MDAERFEDLLDRFPDGEETPAEAEELAAALDAEPARRQAFVERALLEAQLYRLHAGQAAAAKAVPAAPRRRAWVRWAAAAAVLAVACLGAAFAYRATRTGTETGEVAAGQVQTDGALVTRVLAGQDFRVTGQQPARLRLADESTVVLQPGTEGTLQPEQGQRGLELRRGKGDFDVRKGRGKFRVQTPVANVTVLGTRFSVELQKPRGRGDKEEDRMNGRLAWALTVAVVAGSVSVDFDGKQVVLSAGQRQVFAQEGEGGGEKKTVTGGQVVRVDGANVICQQGGDKGAKEITIATNAATVIVSIEGYRDVPGGEGGKGRKEPIFKAGTLADLTAGVRIRATLVNDVATRIEIQPAPAAKVGGEGEAKPAPDTSAPRRREGEK